MKARRRQAIVLLLCCWSAPTLAHPVAFANSMMFMSSNRPEDSEFIALYSPTHWLGLAGVFQQDRMGDSPVDLLQAQVGLLVHRWNLPAAQANLYAFGAAGSAQDTESSARAAALSAGFQADWETRHHYLLAAYRRTWAGELVDGGKLELRGGWAPLVGEYNELNGWLIVQADHNPERRRDWDLTPLLRFYMKNVLWETGVSLNGKWLFNFMVSY